MDLRMGVYRHYKGHLYQVIGLGHDANDAERTVVIYFALQLDEAHEGPRLAVRTIDDFTALLHVTNGTVCEHSDKCSPDLMQRFEYLGPEFKKEMLT